MSDLIELVPATGNSRPLEGGYLAHDLRSLETVEGRPYVYANFIVSLDGRIAIPQDDGRGLRVPPDTANDRDWRLYQELAAQADLIISSGRYLRDWAEGRAQEILQVDDPRYADLREWRDERGLSPHPDIAIVSGSLAFPVPDVLTAGGRRIVVFTAGDPDPARVAEIEADAGEVVVVGDGGVNGATMVAEMAARGYRTVYSGAGPQILHLLLSADVVDRLYLTHAGRILGGRPFASIVEGDLLEEPVGMRLAAAYLDGSALDGLGQLFLTYERVR